MCGRSEECWKANMKCNSLMKMSCSEIESNEQTLVKCYEEYGLKKKYDEFCKFLIYKLTIC